MTVPRPPSFCPPCAPFAAVILVAACGQPSAGWVPGLSSARGHDVRPRAQARARDLRDMSARPPDPKEVEVLRARHGHPRAQALPGRFGGDRRAGACSRDRSSRSPPKLPRSKPTWRAPGRSRRSPIAKWRA